MPPSQRAQVLRGFAVTVPALALSVLAGAPSALAANSHADAHATSNATSHATSHANAHAAAAHNHQTQGTSGTSGDVGQPQPISTADQNSGGANGQCPGGAYCSTRDGSPSLNGNGGGQATGKPCAGCVGKADNKNPPGQAPDGSDANAGYECDRNHGIGRTNPAHTGWKSGGTDCTATPNAPECVPGGTDCTATPDAPECVHNPGVCVPTAANNFCTDVLGEKTTRTPTAVLGEKVVRAGTLPFTGAAIAL